MEVRAYDLPRWKASAQPHVPAQARHNMPMFTLCTEETDANGSIIEVSRENRL
jgi:hypothetical protein